jgi:serine/threonine protein kinase
MCLVTQLLGGDVKTLYEARNGKCFPLPLAKRILLHVLRGIAHAHRSGVVHTDLKHDNIFFDSRMSTTEIEKLVASEPALRHPPETSCDGIVQVAVSQPLPVPALEEAMKCTFVVADFGSGIIIGFRTN